VVFGVALVAATYIHFLLFAQFGFLDLLQTALHERSAVESAMLAMGLCGLSMSLLAGWWLGKASPRSLLHIALVGCVMASGLAPLCQSQSQMVAIAALTGASTALLTVTVASSLRSVLPARGFATWVGVGTGSAYLICNIPILFAGTVFVRCWVPCVVSFVVLLWSWASRPSEQLTLKSESASTSSFADYRGIGFLSVVLSFLALIWFDSAAFAIIQENSVLKNATWGSSEQMIGQGLWHFGAAVGAGFLLDRGWFRSLLVLSFAFLATALGGLDQGLHAGPLYVVGVSTYSTALVAFPGLAPGGSGLIHTRWRAAILYGVAGWLGSALGVGMAQNLHQVPASFLVVAGAVLMFGFAVSSHGALRRAFGIAAFPVLLGALAIAIEVGVTGGVSAGIAVGADLGAKHEEDASGRGRRVYIAEGCVNCHSQYVRAGTVDEVLWGPAGGFSRHDDPPMPGNRRQGPDLARVGNRRSAQWQRLHLIDPRSLNPFSRMPSYAHLFDDGRGDDLVAYLTSLGEDTVEQRYLARGQYTIDRPTSEPSPARGAILFRDYCVSCHGDNARGDGRFAESVAGSGENSLDLLKPTLVLLPKGDGAEPEQAALARLIKFGMINTSMPGHETFSNQELFDLVAFLQSLRVQSERPESSP
jgi:cbb3-type cytochrome oxidase cytochrome c subunit